MALSGVSGEMTLQVRTDGRERNRFEITKSTHSFCRRAFFCLGTLGLIPAALGAIALLGGFGEMPPTHGACLAFAGGVSFTTFFETCLIMTVLQEVRKDNIGKKGNELG